MRAMAFNAGAALLDALVLSIVSDESTYGYKITQDVRAVMDVSESTLYPVLRRLQKEACLDTYDRAFAGRNRRYYSITEKGCERLEEYRHQWREYAAQGEHCIVWGGTHMKREEFLARLEQGLVGLGEEERAEALKFYNEYLDEVGPGQEEQE